uniref:Uncharacterized membrane protein ycf78 n=2 Tax=Chlamydomonas reinhardtii TaxID=3055 RepID=YCF78_CHLRE|nr:hypothetical protein ChreCp059 [Chlamydomonas reinhardtii]P36495.2 RecName: Full=Uncharacterized membrane protein ycf78; AltName: Full=ORF-S; AltName: Full=ORF1995; AltName: Full=ORFA [Chlamydomonas reinhardtii]7XZI_A Chain A, Tic214 [Chlamydomonas reinhardtii]7XZJ_A Chain A, Tic214 [Chlamydomonas reinhardtii]CAA63385.1 ORF1995 [Chlamydomonas reinhardtii]DAA00959.1 TPA_inf: hypothetical protein [Chlamydomonas reinhardtii]|eukprot:NP_958415.1 hypothetical protein ChreCp059 (chloroplast) [Chlamydomonas reinhardtii]
MITFTFMSLVTSVKDYVEITHKLIEIEPLKNYTEFGAVFTYFIFSIGEFFKNFFSFSFLNNIWSIPIIIPDIASAMISEVSVLDGYFHNAFTFLETSVNTTTNPSLVIFEKFVIGIINSLFLILPTSTSHLITLRRFVMQGLEAGYMAGLGTLAGNFLWLASIILGWRFFVIPWLSLDIFRYLLGFVLLVKYIWDSSKERRMALEDLSKWKIFLLNFLLALTEQSCIYPFISNLSFGPDASILEGFPVDNYPQFLLIHGAYLLGILFGSFSLLQFTCWFWENPAFSIYLWITTKSSLKISTSSYYKILNFTFLYATMLCAIASIPYYGLDYTITNPIGLVPQDRILNQKKSQSDPDKLITETAFLNLNPTDKNSRIRDGVHARRERWKQRLIKYQAFDASTYDQGVYDFLTIEDLNYGFDRFWLRRKMRNHQIRFRLFPGPWMRSLKKQLNNPANPSLETSTKAASGPRVEFFRILFEQFYHPNFHDRAAMQTNPAEARNKFISTSPLASTESKKALNSTFSLGNINNSSTGIEGLVLTNTQATLLPTDLQTKRTIKPGLIYTNSALRKFVRNVNTRLNLKLLNSKETNLTTKYKSQFIYSKRWKSIFSKIQPLQNGTTRKSYQLFRNVAKQILVTPDAKSLKLITINQKLSLKERKLLELRTQYNNNSTLTTTAPLTLVRPLNVYLQKEEAFKRKLRYYGTMPMRKLTVGNQAPYFKALMKRGFYYYKPTLRWRKTLYVASLRRGFRKKSRKQRILVMPSNQQNFNNTLDNTKTNINQNNLANPLGGNEVPMYGADGENSLITKPTHSYTVLGKRASRYRHQIYKDVLQHWYYTPFNRLLMKFDVDAFINRQPKSHFLTKNEERALHIRRFLLSEHYDTLRWYTYMQHYKTMKTNIGGTKSFANRAYNQQFQGTFKKIRHLFAITPKQGDFYTLKFDQPLYNDNKLKDNLYFHEELLTDYYNGTNLQTNQTSNISVNSTTTFIDNSLRTTQLPVPSSSFDIVNQSSTLIGLTTMQNALRKNVVESTLTSLNSDGEAATSQPKLNFVYSELFVKLIKECKKRIHDQTFLKNYITHRIEKREQLNQEQTKELNKRLEKLKVWLNSDKGSISKLQNTPVQDPNISSPDKVLTTAMQKAVNESISLSGIMPSDKIKTTYGNLTNAYTIKTENAILTKLNVINQLTNNETTTQKNTLIKSIGVNKIQTVLQTIITNFKSSLYNQTQLLRVKTDKDLQWWRTKQRVITKRKSARKRDRFKKQIAVVNKKLAALSKKVETEKSNLYQTLYGNYEISDYLLRNVPTGSSAVIDSTVLRKKQDNQAYLPKETNNVQFNSFVDSNNNVWQTFFAKKLRKKISSKGRRYRSLSLARYLTATRKPRLVGLDNLTKIDNITTLQGAFITKEEKQDSLNLTIQRKQELTNSLKKSQIKKRSRHSWKKRSRHQFSRNHYKYRKRHTHGNGKLRVMNKKLKKFKATNELRQWWWNSFLPRYLSNLQVNNSTLTNKNVSFKPLSNTNSVPSTNMASPTTSRNLLDNLNSSNQISTSASMNQNIVTESVKVETNQVYLPEGEKSFDITSMTTTLPFYAGWDESLKKFVVTNRLLSRRDAGLSVNNNPQEINFTNPPIQGLNEGSFLYWQTEMPFNSYNIDQFITTNQSFYAPLGWRRFEFRHSILKTWVNNTKAGNNNIKKKTLIISLKNLQPLKSSQQKQNQIKTKKLVARRIKKRYKLLKQMPNQLMYSPTGPLLTEVLPSHYISVFDQQYRLPRNRYLKRNPLKTLKKTTLLALMDSSKQTNGVNKEFTLRKRVKPRRKYHRKRFIKKDGLIFPRRTKFNTNTTLTGNALITNNVNSIEEDDLRWRPSSRTKQKRKDNTRSSAASKTKSNKRVKTNPLRLRQLRRREFQQVLKPLQRYIPQNGGFTWPGDYLRLEIVEMPKLKSINIKKTSLKQKINVQPVGIMPRKYLIEKHNIKVLKKKLSQAYSTQQLTKVVQEYKNLIQNSPPAI